MKIRLKDNSKAGFGAVFMFAIGIVVVMTIFVMTQFMTGQSATAEIEASDLGNRAGIVAESAAEECSYYTLLKSNDIEDDSPEAKKLFETLRTFEKRSSTYPSKEGPTSKGLKYLWNTKFCLPMNKNYYQSDSENDNITIDCFAIGPLKQKCFPQGPKLSNESSGILGIEGKVTVKSKTGGPTIEREVQFARDFRVLLLHPPYPFNNYTLYLKRKTGTIPDKFHSYFRAFEDSQTPLISEFPISDMSSDERPIVSTASEIKPESFNIRAFNEQSGIDMNNLTTKQIGQLATDISYVKAAKFTKLAAETSTEYVQDNYYNQLDWNSFKNKASHYYPDFGRFVYDNAKDSNLKLNGIYYIEKGVVLDHTFSGRGIIVTTNTEDMVIRNVKRSSSNDRLTIVTINSNFDIRGTAKGGQSIVEADIFAPNGTITDPSLAHIKGTVYLSHLDPSNGKGPWIELPDDTATIPWTDGDELDDKYANKLAVILSPGYSWKRYWNKRK